MVTTKTTQNTYTSAISSTFSVSDAFIDNKQGDFLKLIKTCCEWAEQLGYRSLALSGIKALSGDTKNFLGVIGFRTNVKKTVEATVGLGKTVVTGKTDKLLQGAKKFIDEVGPTVNVAFDSACLINSRIFPIISSAGMTFFGQANAIALLTWTSVKTVEKAHAIFKLCQAKNNPQAIYETRTAEDGTQKQITNQMFIEEKIKEVKDIGKLKSQIKTVDQLVRKELIELVKVISLVALGVILTLGLVLPVPVIAGEALKLAILIAGTFTLACAISSFAYTYWPRNNPQAVSGDQSGEAPNPSNGPDLGAAQDAAGVGQLAITHTVVPLKMKNEDAVLEDQAERRGSDFCADNSPGAPARTGTEG